MAVFHYHRRRSAGERDVDAAIVRAQARYRELELKLEVLDREIAATRQLASAAGIFDERTMLPPQKARARKRRRIPRPAARTALARAALRGL